MQARKSKGFGGGWFRPMSATSGDTCHTGSWPFLDMAAFTWEQGPPAPFVREVN